MNGVEDPLLLREERAAPAFGGLLSEYALFLCPLNDHDVDNAVTGKVVDPWRSHGAADVRTYQLPAELHLGHDMIEVEQPDHDVETLVYPKAVRAY